MMNSWKQSVIMPMRLPVIWPTSAAPTPPIAGPSGTGAFFPRTPVQMLEEERGEKVEVPKTAKMDWSVVRKKIAKHGMRNSNVIAIAPTATISNIMGSSPCIEPTYKNIFVKSNLSGDFMVLNRFLVNDLKKEGLWNREMSDQLKYFDGELGPIEGMSRTH